MWHKGQSGNPKGRMPNVAKALDTGAAVQPTESIYIPILDKRDPARELIKLADSHSDKRYKMEIWMFLFSQKYKASKIVSKPIPTQLDDGISDEDTLKALESQVVKDTGLETKTE